MQVTKVIIKSILFFIVCILQCYCLHNTYDIGNRVQCIKMVHFMVIMAEKNHLERGGMRFLVNLKGGSHLRGGGVDPP